MSSASLLYVHLQFSQEQFLSHKSLDAKKNNLRKQGNIWLFFIKLTNY